MGGVASNGEKALREWEIFDIQERGRKKKKFSVWHFWLTPDFRGREARRERKKKK